MMMHQRKRFLFSLVIQSFPTFSARIPLIIVICLALLPSSTINGTSIEWLFKRDHSKRSLLPYSIPHANALGTPSNLPISISKGMYCTYTYVAIIHCRRNWGTLHSTVEMGGHINQTLVRLLLLCGEASFSTLELARAAFPYRRTPHLKRDYVERGTNTT